MLVNRPAAALLRAAREAKGLGSGNFNGFATRTADQSRLIVSALREMQAKAPGPLGDAIGKVADEVEAAAQHDPDGLIAVARFHHPGSWDDFRRTLGEEMHHREAIRLTRGENPETKTARIVGLLENENYRKAVQRLVESRPQLADRPEAQSLEIAAAIAMGREGAVGLTAEEARDVYDTWANGLENAHGKEKSAGAVLRAYPRLRKELIDARYASIRDNLRGRGQSGGVRENADVSGGPRPPGGGGPASSGEDSAPLEGSRERSRTLRSRVEADQDILDAKRRAAGQAGLFSEADEQASRVESERDRDQLLGQRLTAQFKSGGAVKPSKLKPAETGDLSGEAQPEQGGLFGSERGSFSRKPKYTVKEGPTFKKQNSPLRDAADFFKPVGTRIRQEGWAGEELARELEHARDTGEVQAGKRVVALKDSGLDKLSREDRRNLVDSLQGFATPKSPAVRKALDGIRAVTDEIAGEAEKAKVETKIKMTLRPEDPLPAGARLTAAQQSRRDAGGRVAISYRRPFHSRPDYYPHVIPSADALKKGDVRRDVIDNLVRNRIRETPEDAAAFLDEYRKYIDTGGRSKAMEAYLVDSGQARDASEALEPELLPFLTGGKQCSTTPGSFWF